MAETQEERTTKNDVFKDEDTAPKPVRVPSHVPTQQNPLADLGIEIPYETVPLPSLGLVYPSGHPLHMKRTIDIKPMTAREEDILMSPALMKSGTAITELIRSSLVDKSINPREMLSGDRHALTVAIRITGYGSEYTTRVTCPSCDTVFDHTFNLGALPIRALELDPVERGSNLFVVDLPQTKVRLHFSFMTGILEEENSQAEEQRKKNNIHQSNAVTTRLITAIRAVNGNTNRTDIMRFATNMPAFDSSWLRRYIDDNEPGINMRQNARCTNVDCGEVNELNVPLGVSFFWPHARR